MNDTFKNVDKMLDIREKHNGGTEYKKQVTDIDIEHIDMERSESHTRFESLNFDKSKSPMFN